MCRRHTPDIHTYCAGASTRPVNGIQELKNIWKNHFNIFHYVRIIIKASEKVFSRTLTSAWKNLWQDCVAARDIEAFDTESVAVDDIVSLGKSMGLDVDSDDVEDLVEDQRNEMTTEELQELRREQQEEVVEERFSEEEESKGSISTAEIKEPWRKHKEWWKNGILTQLWSIGASICSTTLLMTILEKF
ncbi:hypothetical protein FHG87_021181 [Trinorchestia longiramus]|nr:hypothetical protein FHG87_021181 [Trinorchestia longiramus]